MISEAVEELVEAREIVPASLEGDEEDVWYTSVELLENHLVVRPGAGPVFLLSPFDNLVIRRDWLKKLFAQFKETLIAFARFNVCEKYVLKRDQE